MIICQPRKSVVYLISAIIGGSFLLAGYWLYTIITSPASMISFLLACLILALLLFIAIRLATNYIRIQAGENKLTVHYQLLGKAKSYPLLSLTGVEEVKINTFQNKEFRQLIIRFGEEKYH